VGVEPLERLLRADPVPRRRRALRGRHCLCHDPTSVEWNADSAPMSSPWWCSSPRA
jgi:hypothetical protein